MEDEEKAITQLVGSTALKTSSVYFFIGYICSMVPAQLFGLDPWYAPSNKAGICVD